MKSKLLLLLLLNQWAFAQTEVTSFLDSKFTHYSQLSDKIWKYAEPGYLEEKTADALMTELTEAGFSVKKDVGEMQTAFVASYGSGYPVIAILAEMDALPGLSQEAVPARKPLTAKGYGHGCGHNLFGVGSVAAAVAIRNWLEKNKRNDSAHRNTRRRRCWRR